MKGFRIEYYNFTEPYVKNMESARKFLREYLTDTFDKYADLRLTDGGQGGFVTYPSWVRAMFRNNAT